MHTPLQALAAVNDPDSPGALAPINARSSATYFTTAGPEGPEALGSPGPQGSTGQAGDVLAMGSPGGALGPPPSVAAWRGRRSSQQGVVGVRFSATDQPTVLEPPAEGAAAGAPTTEAPGQSGLPNQLGQGAAGGGEGYGGLPSAFRSLAHQPSVTDSRVDSEAPVEEQGGASEPDSPFHGIVIPPVDGDFEGGGSIFGMFVQNNRPVPHLDQ